MCAALAASEALAQEVRICPAGDPDAPSVYIDSSASDVVVVTPGGQQLVAARDLLLCPGDEVRTGATGRVAIRFEEKRTVIRLDGNSRTRVLSGGTGGADVSLLSGVLYFISSVRRHFEVETPYIVAGIDGTEALVGVEPPRALALAAVREGRVSTYDRALGPQSTLSVGAGEAAFRSASVPFQSAPIGALPPPFRDLLIVSDSAVDWAVYYPPIMLARDPRHPAIQRAATLLSSGDYDRASRSLDGAEAADPAAAASLRTIIAVGRNRLDEADHWAAVALASGPDFAPAHIAASYARQARGELEAALEAAQAAERLAPDDAYVAARVAELHMTLGDRRAALASADRALSIERRPLALFVAGLARLATWQYRDAEALFQEAIALDEEAPLPRLGLGLAYIRQGRTAAGTWEMERAVAHDPNRSALRTWLGRAYFDEGLAAKASQQFEVAKAEDPEDPTPYLFSALELYARNRPIPALRELKLADERGQARRVLRSERGLGEDSATRGAALGRIYDVLGFEQLAIVEGTQAADAAPANPGAHRFLADAFRQRRGYEIAQTSELLRSQLLSPPSKTPVQPELAEADLALLDTTGPSRVTFAEFSPLFDSDGLRVDASGVFGTQKTWGDQLAVTGLSGGTSLSVGQYHFETDGFRENNDLTHDIFNAVATVAVTPEFSFFGEYRNRQSDGGDRRIDFDIGDCLPSFRSQLDRQVARLGFHAEPTASTDLIGVYTWANLKTGDQVEPFPGFLDTQHREDDSHGVQLQHIWQGASVRNVAGGAYVANDVTDEFSFFGGVLTGADEFSTDYFNAYDYLYVDYPMGVSWTLGGSVVSFETDDIAPGFGNPTFDVLEFLPKIGVTAELVENVTLRAAYLKNLKPELVSEQVIEPTTVAGFNQFYDAFNTSLLEQAGVGLDVQLADWLMVGAEGVWQWWHVPRTDAPPPETDEIVARAYAYATLTDEFALSAEVIRESSNSDLTFDDFEEWRTTSVPVTLSYFAPNGLFGTLGAEYVDHRIQNFGMASSDSFTVVNASLGFRLPDNAGILSVEVRNLFDESFNYQNRTRRPDIAAQPRYAPERVVQARAVLRF